MGSGESCAKLFYLVYEIVPQLVGQLEDKPMWRMVA